MATSDQIDTITKHYLIALLWTMPGNEQCDNPGACIDLEDLPLCPRVKARYDVTEFVHLCGAFFDQVMECFADGYGQHPGFGSAEAAFGHDFALTRNHNGCGFWDRESEGLPKFLGDALTRVCQKHFAEANLYIRDDGKAYF